MDQETRVEELESALRVAVDEMESLNSRLEQCAIQLKASEIKCEELQALNTRMRMQNDAKHNQGSETKARDSNFSMMS